jgi:N-acetylneuraminate synthase
MNLRAIPHLAETFGVAVGLSDHTLGSAAAVAAVVLGACVVEKHFCLSRSIPNPDAAFSMEPAEFRQMHDDIRAVERAMGKVQYGVSAAEEGTVMFRRSLFIVQDMKAGETFTTENLRSIRPGYGLAPRHYDEVIGRRAAGDISRGTPLAWNLVR